MIGEVCIIGKGIQGISDEVIYVYMHACVYLLYMCECVFVCVYICVGMRSYINLFSHRKLEICIFKYAIMHLHTYDSIFITMQKIK